MPTYHTGSVRYHVSEFLSDRHPYNPATGFDTQRQREAGLVKNSHESIALDRLQEDLMTFDDPNEKVKALRALTAHSSAAEIKIALLRKGIVARLAATLMQSRKRSADLAESGGASGASTGTASPLPHIQQLEPFNQSSDAHAAWCLVESQTAQLLRSLCVLPQGVHCVIEEGGWTALIASVADIRAGRSGEAREAARVCAATAIALLSSTGAALNWLSAGAIDVSKEMELEGYVPWEAFYSDFAPLYTTDGITIEAELKLQKEKRKKSPPSAPLSSSGSASAIPSASASAPPLVTPFEIAVQRLDSIDSRERVLTAFFDTVVSALAAASGKDKDAGGGKNASTPPFGTSPKLLVSLLDTVGNLLKMERCLHLGLIAGLLRALSSYVGTNLLKDDLWLHSSGTSAASPAGIIAADPKTATLATASAAHMQPGTAPVAARTSSGAGGSSSSLQIDIASKICNILWHIGLDSVGKQEVLELYQVCFQTGQLLQLLLANTAEAALLSLKALAAGALGAMALLPDLKKMMAAKASFPIEIPKPEAEGEAAAPTWVLSGNKDANGLERSFVDSLLDLLRQANAITKAKFPHTANTASSAAPPQRLSIADTALKRDLTAVVTNAVAALRLIAELPAARQYLHSAVFFTNSPPANLDGPPLTVAAASEGKEHELRRQLFYSTRWEKEFKVYVY